VGFDDALAERLREYLIEGIVTRPSGWPPVDAAATPEVG
jgi:hypothetical protein